MFTRSKPQPALSQEPVALAAASPTPSIRELPYLELKALHAAVSELLAQRETEERQTFKADFLNKMAEYGMTLDDFKQKTKEKKKRDTKPKYQHPDDASMQWRQAAGVDAGAS